METMQAMTLEYLKTRQQFGKPIGENQALQHRAGRDVDVAGAGPQHGDAGGDDGRRAERRASARTTSRRPRSASARPARFVSQNAVQLHGGIGMTEEYAVGHYFRRCMVIEHSFGDTGHHLSRIADRVR